ncbi:unnamed protein product [Closterium sp. Naga37s-1]|nr:unnamed protein product [Closterium sp. Naga37s-1]
MGGEPSRRREPATHPNPPERALQPQQPAPEGAVTRGRLRHQRLALDHPHPAPRDGPVAHQSQRTGVAKDSAAGAPPPIGGQERIARPGPGVQASDEATDPPENADVAHDAPEYADQERDVEERDAAGNATREIAGVPRDEEEQGIADRPDEENRAEARDEPAIAHALVGPRCPAQRRQSEPVPATPQATQGEGIDGAEETARAQGIERAHSQQDDDAQQRAEEPPRVQRLSQAGHSPRSPLSRRRDPRSAPLPWRREQRTPAGQRPDDADEDTTPQQRQTPASAATPTPLQQHRPIPLLPTPARRQGVSDADPPTRRSGAGRGRETRGIRVGRGNSRRGRGRGATTQRRGASSFARAAQRVLRQRAREGGETLGDNSGNGSSGDPPFIPEREGSSSPSTEEDEVDPAQGVGEIPTGGRTASAIRTPRNRAARGNRAATNTGVTTTPDNAAPIISADDLAGRQDLFADIANWDLCPLRDSRQPPLARHPPRPLRESFAICLLTPLLHLAKNPDLSPGWKLLMFLPRILLLSSSARKPDWKTMADRLTRFRQGLWRDLYDEAADAVTNNPQPRHVPDTTGKLARAEGLAKRGNLAKSLQSLTATPVCTPSAEVLSALTARHPEATLAIPDWVHDFASETVPSITAREAANCTEAFTHLTEALLSHGLAHNPAKCEAWSATTLDPAALPLGVSIPLDGVRVLGSPIGPPTGCAARVRERLSAAAEPLPLLSQMDPQLCLLLLTRCVSRRASFLVRATPLEALPLGDWSAWGEDLLHTYLAAAHTTIPRDRAERDRIWQQAALPASLGGLGITNPAVEGGFAYLASVVSAAHLLRSFGDSANPALTGLLSLMDADGESTSLLPRRLAALEAELPPDGIEALQEPQHGEVAAMARSAALTESAPLDRQQRAEETHPRSDLHEVGCECGGEETEGRGTLGEVAAAAAAQGTIGAVAIETARAAGTGDADAEVTGAAEAAGTEAAVLAEAARVVPEAAAAAVSVAAGSVEDHVLAGETAAASGDGSFSPSATPQTAPLSPEEGEPLAEQGQLGEAGLAASPAPVAASVIAEVVSAAVGRRDGEPNGEEAAVAAASTGTPAADGGADTQGHGQVAGGRRGRGKGVAAPAVRGKTGKRPRAQPAPRRPGAGLGPGPPGPLLGWLLQGQPPQGPERQSSSRGEASAPPPTEQEQPPADATEPQPSQTEVTAPMPARPAMAGGSDAATVAAQGSRRSARLGQISWGPPRGGRTPWMPAGRGGASVPGNAGGGVTATVGGAARGRRGGMRGGLRGGRGGRNPLGRTDIPVRSGPWRERHNRPEPVAVDAPANEEQEGLENNAADPEFIGEEEAESEEISLDEEPASGRNNEARRGREAAAPTTQIPDKAGEAATDDTDVPSPSDLADTDGVWQMAGEWNVDLLQRGDQPWLDDSALPPEAHPQTSTGTSHW